MLLSPLLNRVEKITSFVIVLAISTPLCTGIYSIILPFEELILALPIGISLAIVINVINSINDIIDAYNASFR